MTKHDLEKHYNVLARNFPHLPVVRVRERNAGTDSLFVTEVLDCGHADLWPTRDEGDYPDRRPCWECYRENCEAC